MNKVPIMIVEDKEIDIKSLTLPKDSLEFEFSWSPLAAKRVANRGDFQEIKKYLSGIGPKKNQRRLSGLSLIFIDLGLKVGLTKSESNELHGWLGTKPHFERGQEQGLYLLGVALQNEEWGGVLVVASGQGEYDIISDMITNLKEKFDRTDVFIETINMGLGGVKPQKVLEFGINKFFEHHGSIEKRLWPNYISDWFSSRSNVPHNYPAKRNKKNELCRNTIYEYLKDLFRFNPPEHWLSEDQCKILWQELSHLVGMKSTAQHGKGRNLTLGNVVLLLAATTAGAETWVKNINWMYETKEILPEQNSEQARKAILALVKDKDGLFPSLSKDDDSGSPLVRDVYLSPDGDHLLIYLRFDCSKSTKAGRESLLDKVSNLIRGNSQGGESRHIYDGTVFEAYLSFLIESAKSEKGREARCVVNLYPTRNSEETILEIRPCH